MGNGDAGFAAMNEQTVRDGSNGWKKSVWPGIPVFVEVVWWRRGSLPSRWEDQGALPASPARSMSRSNDSSTATRIGSA